ncbi:MAG: DUF11 domain-containing protein [Pseudomonadota bacterium]
MRSLVFICIVSILLGYSNPAEALNSFGLPFIEVEDGYEMTLDGGVLHVNESGHWNTQLANGEIVRQSISGAQIKALPSGHINVVVGAREEAWRKVSFFQELSFGEVAPGIEAWLTATAQSAELIISIAPGGDVSNFQVNTNQLLSLSPEGALQMGGGASLSAPIAWQTIEDEQVAVDVRFSISGKRYGFKLGEYDAQHTVYIDPVIATTYVGSNSDFGERVLGVAHSDSRSRIYVAGYLPDTDAFQGVINDPAIEADKLYVTAFDSELQTLVGGIIFGGSGFNFGHGFAYDESNGEIYLVGQTSAADWPSTADTIQPALNSGDSRSIDGFIAVIDPDLTEVSRATYFGGFCVNEGGLVDIIYDAALHANGDLYISGITCNLDLPMRTGGAYEEPPGTPDTGYAFVSRITSDLSSTLQSTYFGGSSRDEVEVMLAAADGRLYVAGETRSNDFDGVGGGAVPNTTIGVNGFVIALEEDLSNLMGGTYLGGANSLGVLKQTVTGLAQIQDDIFAVGTTSTNDFPATDGGALSTFPLCSSPNCTVGFVARLSDDLSELMQATYLGGSGEDQLHAIQATNEAIFVGGGTTSTDVPGAMSGIQAENQGMADGLLARLTIDLSTIEQTTYFGTSRLDTVSHLLVDGAAQRLWVTGVVTADDNDRLPGALMGAIDTGVFGEDGYVSLMDLTLSDEATPPDTTPTPFSFDDRADALTDTQILSNVIQVADVNSETNISVVGGQYSINGGAFTSDADVINNGDTVQLAVTTPTTNSTSVDVVLTIGGVSDTWTVTTVNGVPQLLLEKRVELIRPEGLQEEILTTLGGIGELVRYTISVSNSSDQLASGIVLIDTLPTELGFVSSGDAGYDPETGQFSISELSAQQTQSFTIDALTQVNPDGTQVTNTAELAGVNPPFMAGVEASAEFALIDQVDMQIFVDLEPELLGSGVLINAQIENLGPGNARESFVRISIFEDEAELEDLSFVEVESPFDVSRCEVDAGSTGLGVICASDPDVLFRPGTSALINMRLRAADGGVNFRDTGVGARGTIDTSSLDINSGNDTSAGEFVTELVPDTTPETSSRCFIATAAYGSEFAEELTVLRHFRDQQLLTHRAGRWLVSQYYEYSPPVADYIAGRDSLRFIVRTSLTPIVFMLSQPSTAAMLILFAFAFVMLLRLRQRGLESTRL